MTKQQRLVLVTSILASFVAFLDIAIVNVALPAIRAELGGGLAAQQWVIDGYLLTLGSLILIAGSLSDLFGRKRILIYGLIGFGVTSMLAALAPSTELLVIARILQGIAGALLVPSSLALIIATFSGPAQSRAIGIWTAWSGTIAFIIGPLLGGLLVDTISWRLVFAINIIPIAVTVWLISLIAHEPEHRKDAAVDYLGAVLAAAGLGGTVFALIEQPRLGWIHPLIIIPLLAGLAALAAFVVHERRAEHPMLPLDLFKSRNFSVGNLATVAIYSGLTAATFLLILFVQQVGGFTALSAGLSVLPVTIIMFLLSSRFGTLAGKYGPRIFMTVGPIVAGTGFLLMLRVSSELNYLTELLPGILIFGIGLAVTVAPLTSAVLGSIDKAHAGIASAVNNAMARVAGLLAVAAIGAIVATQFAATLENKLADANISQPSRNAIAEAKIKPLDIKVPAVTSPADVEVFESALREASVSSFRTGVGVMAVLVILGGIISGVGIKNPKQAAE